MKRLIIYLFSSHIIFFLITSAIILGLNLTPAIAQFRHAPKGRSFALIHNNTQDFFFYQSLMNEGGSGAWLTTNPYTTEPHKPSIIFAYFLWLGKLSKLFGISYAFTYHLVRIILSILFLSFIFYLLSFISLPYPRLAYLFFLFAAPFIHTVNTGGKLTRVPYMYWWTGMDPIRRVAYLPHHIFGGLLLVITFILIIKYFDNPKTKYIIWCCLLTIPLAFVHPPSLLIALITLPIALAVFSLRKPARAALSFSHFFEQAKKWEYIFIYWFIGLFILLFMVSQTNQGFPWNQYINWEKTLQFPLDRELIGALGILFPFSILGAIRAIASKRFHYILIACWLFVPLFLIPFAPYLNISNVRLIQGVPFLPLAILAVLGIEFLQTSLKAFFTRKSQIPKSKIQTNLNDRNPKSKTILSLKNLNLNIVWNLVLGAWNFKFIGLLGYWVIGLFFIIFTIPTLSWSLKDQIREYWPIYGNVYFDNRLFDAFSFINHSFPAKANTLSTFYTGNYLPAFTNTISFIGHFGYTYNSQVKQVQVQKFFENKMSIQEAKELIMNNKIALVFQGPEEKPIYSSYLYPSVLKPVYDKEEVTLYKLR